MPWYRSEGKIEQPLSDKDFKEGMEEGLFLTQKHKAYCVLLYYSAVRKHEGLRATKEHFQVLPDRIIFIVGKRLKHGIETPGLPIPLNAPYVNELLEALGDTKPKKRVFPYCDRTGYNIVHRAFKYPHLFRLSRITNFFLEGWTIAQVHSWTGLTLKALDYYLGLVDVSKMGESLAKKKD
jgi:integrase